MDLKEKLQLFKAARWDWIVGTFFYRNCTGLGLCFYFSQKHNVSYQELDELELHWLPYRTTEPSEAFHFSNRIQRIWAIKQVIKDLKQAIKLQENNGRIS